MIQESPISGPLRILLVEDNEDDYTIVREMLTNIYSLDGFELTWLDSPQHAMESFFNNSFDVVLCDNFLGSGTGIDLIKQIRASMPTCPPIILLTSVDDLRLDRGASAAGAFDFLVKQDLTVLKLERSIRFATHRKNFEKELIQVAHYDHLTGAANRKLFEFTLEAAIKQSTRSEKKVGLVLFDLDHFKDVNDTYGHPIGDKLLLEVTRRITGSIRETDFLARLGGDEFCIVVSQLEEARHLAPLVAEIIASISEPYLLDKLQVSIGASAGIAIYPSDAANSQELVKAADVSLYRAKEKAKGSFNFYSPELNGQIDWRNSGRNSSKLLSIVQPKP